MDVVVVSVELLVSIPCSVDVSNPRFTMINRRILGEIVVSCVINCEVSFEAVLTMCLHRSTYVKTFFHPKNTYTVLRDKCIAKHKF